MQGAACQRPLYTTAQLSRCEKRVNDDAASLVLVLALADGTSKAAQRTGELRRRLDRPLCSIFAGKCTSQSGDEQNNMTKIRHSVRGSLMCKWEKSGGLQCADETSCT